MDALWLKNCADSIALRTTTIIGVERFAVRRREHVTDIPNAVRRRRADFVVDSSSGFDHTRAQIRDILREVATMRRR
jgi:dephospho-CoA kinase